MKDLGAPYDYVQTEDAVSEIKRLLDLGHVSSGTGPTSVYLVREETAAVSVMRLKGLGKHLWKETQAQDYIDDLRNEWAD